MNEKQIIYVAGAITVVSIVSVVYILNTLKPKPKPIELPSPTPLPTPIQEPIGGELQVIPSEETGITPITSEQQAIQLSIRP